MKMTTGNEKDAASSSRHAATMPTRPHAPVAKTLNRQSPPPQSILEEGDKSFAKPSGDDEKQGSNEEEEEEKLTPFAGDSEEALAPSPPPLSPPPTITDATTSSPSQSTFFPSAPPPPSSPPRHDIDHANEDHDIHDPPLPSISPPHLQNDPRYRALLSQTLQTALRRERARPSPPTSDLSSCRRALALERRRSLSLALRLAEYELLARYSSCSLHNDMEADEEARMNRIRRWVGRKEREMAEEKGRVVMELEREEERVVNGLMGRLEALRREKEMLEGELRRLGRGGNVGLGGGGAGGMADMGIAGIGGGGSVGIGRSAFGRGLPMTHEGLGRGAQSDEQRLHAQFERMMNVADGPFVRGSRSSVGRSEEVQMNKSGGNSSLNATESQAAVAKGVGDETYVDEGSADVTDCEREETKTQKGCRDDDTTLMGVNDDEEEEDDNDQDILEGMHHDPDMEDELEKLLQKKGSK